MMGSSRTPGKPFRTIKIPRIEGAEFTGERFVFGSFLPIDVEAEHLHRYLWSTTFCKNRTVLDIACGDGYGSAILSYVAKKVIGVDIDPAAIALAQKNYAAFDVDFVRSDCHILPFDDHYFDVICCFETIEHVDRQDLFLRELHRILRHKGLLICSTPDKLLYARYDRNINPFHVSELSSEDFSSLLKTIFKNVSLCGQQFLSASQIVSETPIKNNQHIFFREDSSGHVETTRNLPFPKYVIALASDAALPRPADSVYEGPYDRQVLSSLSGGVEEQRKHAERLEELLQTERVQFKTLEQEFGEKCKHAEQLEALLQSERVQFKTLEQEFAEKCKHAEQLEVLLQSERVQFKTLEQEFGEKCKHAEQLEVLLQSERVQFKTLEQEFAEKCKHAEQLEALLQSERVQFRALVAQTANLQSTIRFMRQSYQKLEQEFLLKSDEVLQYQDENDRFGRENLRFREILSSLIERLNIISYRINRLRMTADWRLGHFLCNTANALCLRPTRRTSMQMLLEEAARYQQWLTEIGDFPLLSSIQARHNGNKALTVLSHLQPNDKDSRAFSESVADIQKKMFPLFEKVSVSIIIPVFNQWEYTKICLDSILDVCSKESVPYEVIIADDHSTDDTVCASDMYGNLSIIRTEQNSGFLMNCNNASLHARGRYLIFLNNDTQVTDGWLSSLVRLMDSDAGIAIAGSKLVYPDGSLQEAGGILWNDGSAWNYGRGMDPNASEYSYVKEVDYVSGASMMVRRSFWDEVGGFDSRYAPAYCEDSDLAFEARSRGYTVTYQPASVVIHYEGGSHGTDIGSGIKSYQIENSRRFYNKWSSVLQQDHFPNGSSVYLARDRSMYRKHLLYIDHYVPHFDQDAGSRTAFHYLRLLRNMGFCITFLGDNFYPHQPYTMTLQQLGIEVLYGPKWAQCWQDWFRENARHIDYVFLNRPHIAEKYVDFIKAHSSSTILYYGHDLHFLREERKALQNPDDCIQSELQKIREMELNVCSKVDVVYYPSQVEVDILSLLLPGKTIRSIPAYIYPSPQPRRTDFFQTEGIVFIGGFAHPPNEEAVRHLVDNIMPHIAMKNPGIKLYIVGSKTPHWLREAANQSIVVLGRISDASLEKLYSRVRIAVVPLLHGAGIKGKLVEALYYGVPVVATSIGAEGLPSCEAIRICDDPVSFANEIISLYEREATLKLLSKEAQKFVQLHFGEDSARHAIGKDISPLKEVVKGE